VSKWFAWGLVATSLMGLAHWHDKAPPTKNVQVTGTDAWNNSINKRDRAVIRGTVGRVLPDHQEHTTRVEVQADDGTSVTVYYNAALWGIKWPQHGERVEVTAQQIGPGKFTLVDDNAVKWIAPKQDTMSWYGAVDFVGMTENGGEKVNVSYEGYVTGVAILPPELLNQVENGHVYRLTGFMRHGSLWVSRVD
jgi:hypothetical protein